MLHIVSYYPNKLCQYADPRLFHNTLHIIKKYNERHAINWTKDNKINFGILLGELHKYTFSIVNIVITTLSNTADFKLYFTFQPILIFCDEAKKAIEIDS